MKKILYIIAGIFAVYLIACSLLKDSFTISKSISVNCSQENAFAAVASFRNWKNWSPWEQKDSTIQTIYTGPETHVGAGMEWTSKKSGDGVMKIIDFKPYDFIRQELSFKDMNNHWITEFSFSPQGNSVNVSWSMYGQLSFFERPFGLINTRFISPDLEQGLLNMKTYLENKSTH